MAVRRIYTALSGLGHTLDRAPGGSFYTLCQSYDFDRRGKIALDSFIAMVVLLENAKRLHAAFDPNRTGTASFDLNQVRSLPPHLTASSDAPHPYRPFALSLGSTLASGLARAAPTDISDRGVETDIWYLGPQCLQHSLCRARFQQHVAPRKLERGWENRDS